MRSCQAAAIRPPAPRRTPFGLAPPIALGLEANSNEPIDQRAIVRLADRLRTGRLQVDGLLDSPGEGLVKCYLYPQSTGHTLIFVPTLPDIADWCGTIAEYTVFFSTPSEAYEPEPLES